MTLDVANLIYSGLNGGDAISLTDAVYSRYGADLDVEVMLDTDDDRAFADIRWHIESLRESRLNVSPRVPLVDRVAYIAARLEALLPLIVAYHQAGAPLRGTVNLNVEDYSDSAGLSLCSARDDAFLIPDTDFLRTMGYAEFREAQMRDLPAWSSRLPLGFWRGSSTGLIWRVGSWRELPRLRLCEIGKARPDLIDAGISSIVQIEHFAAEIEAAGLMRPPVPASEWGRYRYQIDVDGNSNAWAGFFQRLLTGSPVLKVASPFGFQQWFYHRLVPWRHYVPVAADLSDLAEKIEWLNAHERVAELIGQQGRDLAETITYSSELPLAVLSVAAAIAASDTDQNEPDAGRQRHEEEVYSVGI
jgi:hypothetical protein